MDLSAGTLFAGMLVSTAGMGLFMYGKRESRGPQLLVGIGMMALPMFVSGAWPILGIGALFIGALWFSVRAGL